MAALIEGSQGCCAVHDAAQRGGVVARALGFGKQQQPAELRRNHMRVGDAVLLDVGQGLLRLPSVHQYHRVTEMERGSGESQDGGVVERRPAEVNIVGAGLQAVGGDQVG